MGQDGVRVAVPGEAIQAVPVTGQLVLGAGLVAQNDEVFATRAGVVQQANNRVWLEARTKRYIPAQGDVVVGTIIDRYGENFTVDIGGPFQAFLPQLSFEGATRRNRPAVKAGDLIYARVVTASRDAEPQLSCMDTLGRASGYGHLKGGISIEVNTSQARKLACTDPAAPVLDALGSAIQFDMVVGLNGRVWICPAADPKEPEKGKKEATIIAKCILQSEFLTEQQTQTLVAREVRALQA